MGLRPCKPGTGSSLEPLIGLGRAMAGHTPLFSQPGSFWLGAYMVAEAPLLLAASWMEPATRERIADAVLGSPVALLGVVVGAALLGLLVGWLAHRLGFGW
jgi:ABC-type branched-subunit amino acid transport system permease subunit